jgi:hypothetical protein
MTRLAMPCLSLIAHFGMAALAEAEAIDQAGVAARIAELETRYGDVLSDIACDAPAIQAHRLLCASADSTEPLLWQMARLDDMAWVYAVENATGQEVDRANPPRDADFIARRDACADEACLVAVLVEHTDASLGGTSPYAD